MARRVTIDPKQREALADFHSAIASAGVPLVVVGAVARDHGLVGLGAPPSRATLDVDVTVQLDSWEEFEDLVDRVTQPSGRFRRTENPHRVVHANGTPVDVLPFGDLESPPGTIEWPADGARMVVAGFDRIRASGDRLRLNDSEDVAVADLPSLAFMKCLAFSERGEQDPKDLHDLVGLLRARSAHLSEDDWDAFGGGDLPSEVSIDRFGAFVLGRQVARRFGASTVERFLSIFAEAHEPLSRIVDQAVPRRTPDPERTAREVSALLTSFRDGLVHGSE